MTTLPRLLSIALAALSLGLAGCASFRPASETISVSLADLRPLESTAFETRLALTVRVTNTGPEALRLSGARHRLALNGRELGVAVTPDALELPGLSTATQELSFNLSHLALIPLLRELRQEPAARYEIESTFFGAGPLSRGLSSRQSGRLDLSTLAGAAEPGAFSAP